MKDKSKRPYRIDRFASVMRRTKRRKRKQRPVEEEEELDDKTLELLAANSFGRRLYFTPSASLSASSAVGGEEAASKRIDLVHTTIEPTEKVEKEVEGFKLVALAKDPYAGVGKPINASVLDFQKRHFYSNNANRVDSSAFMSQKRIKSIRRWHCLFHYRSSKRELLEYGRHGFFLRRGCIPQRE